MSSNGVLFDEAIKALDLNENKIIVDGTAGGGGHSGEIAKRAKRVISIDQDPDAIAVLNERLGDKENVTIVHDNYSNIKITKASIIRTNVVGKETELSFEGQYWNNSFGNIINGIVKCYYQYKTTSSDKWVTGATTLTLTFDGSKFSFKGLIKGDDEAEGFSVTNNFNIKIYVEDRLSKSTFDLILGSGAPQLAIDQEGVAVGGMYRADLGKGLQIYGKLFLNGKEIKI